MDEEGDEEEAVGGLACCLPLSEPPVVGPFRAAEADTEGRDADVEVPSSKDRNDARPMAGDAI